MFAYNKAQEYVSAVDLQAVNGFVVLARMQESLKEHPYVLIIGQKLETVYEFVKPTLQKIEYAGNKVHELLDHDEDGVVSVQDVKNSASAAFYFAYNIDSTQVR